MRCEGKGAMACWAGKALQSPTPCRPSSPYNLGATTVPSVNHLYILSHGHSCVLLRTPTQLTALCAHACWLCRQPWPRHCPHCSEEAAQPTSIHLDGQPHCGLPCFLSPVPYTQSLCSALKGLGTQTGTREHSPCVTR